MADNKKILIWVGIGSALLLGTGLFFYFRNKGEGDNVAKGDEGSGDSGNGNVNNPPDTGENPKDNVVNHTNPPSGASYPPTPFSNTTEGNKFRAWVNKNYPAYAKKNQLDPSGAYDNSFIRKAFLQYGAEYTKAIVPPAVKTTLPSVEFKAGDGVYLNRNTQSTALYSFPEIKGDYVKGTVRRSDALDKPIGRFIRPVIQGKTPSTTWVKITVPTYRNVDNTINNKSGDFYVTANNISKTAF